jgi:Flp pilus assembly protein TadD
MGLLHHLKGGALLGVIALGGCSDKMTEEEKNADLGRVNAIDATQLNDIVLTFADPDDAVSHFRELVTAEPNNPEYQRDFAASLARANKFAEATVAYKTLVSAGNATSKDRVAYAETLVRTDNWEDARKQLDSVPPTYETYDRYLLEAMMADRAEQWEKADAFYGNARGLTTRPASVLNNWGISNLARGNYARAEELFLESITFDDKLFNPKNNLVIARGRQGNYRLPIMSMTNEERAQLLYNLGLEAVRNGDVDEAKGLFAEALETSPQYFGEAKAALEALDNSLVIVPEAEVEAEAELEPSAPPLSGPPSER